MDVNEELKFLGKFKKKLEGVRGGRVGGGGQDGCERRIEVFVKVQKKNLGGGGGGGGGLGRGGGGGGGGGGSGVRVDVKEELKFWGKFTKKKWGGGR